jgi:hypothetical protein
MLVGTGLITVLFVGAVVGWRLLRDDSTRPGRDTPTWSDIVVVDRLSGDVTWLDENGEVTGESAGSGRVGSVFAADGIVSLANTSVLRVLADAADDEDGLVVELPTRATVDQLSLDERTMLVVGTSGGGDVMVIDPTEGIVTDIGADVASTMPSPPLMFVDTLRTNFDGTLFAVADATNFQTIAVDPDGDGPVFLPDQPVAVGDGLIATSQTVGLQADISLVTLDRSTEANVPTEIPAGGLIADDALTMVSVDGGIFRIEPGDEEADRRGVLAIPAGESVRSAEPAAHGERIVVSGTTFQAIIDLDGTTRYSTVLSQAVEFLEPDLTWACLPVGGSGMWATIVDLTTGEHLADLTGVEVVSVVDDGCTVLAERDGTTEVISPAGVVTIGTFDEVVLAPDGKSVITVADGSTGLIAIEELELGEPLDLTAVAGTNTLITFVPD